MKVLRKLRFYIFSMAAELEKNNKNKDWEIHEVRICLVVSLYR